MAAILFELGRRCYLHHLSATAFILCICRCSSVWNCDRCWSEYSWNTNSPWRRRQTRERIPGRNLTCYMHRYRLLHSFNGLCSGTIQISRYQKGKTNLDFTKARDSEWQWHQLGHVQVCTSLQTDNDTSTPPLSFLQAGCPSCRPTNSVKALKAWHRIDKYLYIRRPITIAAYRVTTDHPQSRNRKMTEIVGNSQWCVVGCT